MVLTRSQKAREEQSSSLVASLGESSRNPLRSCLSRQRSARVVVANGVGGSPTNSAGMVWPKIRSTTIYNSRYRLNFEKEKKVPKPKKCGRCKTCPAFTEETTFKSTVTGKQYNVIENRGNLIHCNSDNVIYLLTCNGCKIQYVGETCQKCNERQNSHRSRIKTYDTTKKDTQLIEHYQHEPCKGQGYSVAIIETINGKGRKNGKMDPTLVTERRKREDFWMKELRTVYPFGLNNRMGKNLDQRDQDESIYLEFNKKKKKRKRMRKRHAKNIVSADQLYEELTAKHRHASRIDTEELNISIKKACSKIPQL